MDSSMELTPKQAKFCDEYLVDLNATRAALRAGYSAATAFNGKLMTLPKIKYHLRQRGAAAAEAAQLSRQKVLEELGKIAFANMGDYFGENSALKTMDQVKDDARAALQYFTVTEGKYGTSIRIRMSNKLSALEKIARHVRFYDAPEAGEFEEVTDASLAADDRYDDAAAAAEKAPLSNNAARAGYDEDDDIPSDEDIRRWMMEERERAIYETETRLRAEYEEKLKQYQRGARVAGEDNGTNQPAVVEDRNAKRAEVGGIAVRSNTDKSHPVPMGPADARAAMEKAKAGLPTYADAPVGERVIGDREGEYTPEGYLIMHDNPDRDPNCPYYNPYEGLYIYKRIGSMVVKSYLPGRAIERLKVKS
jgi:phage terminase small subunit